MYVPGLPKTQAFMNQLTWIMNGAANDPKMKTTQQRDYSTYRLSADALSVELRNFGFRVLGSGHYSVVLDPSSDVIMEQQSSKWVVKLGCTIEDNWLAFAVYCMQHPSPWFPKVYKIAIHDKFYIVIMERLSVAHELPDGMSRHASKEYLWSIFCTRYPGARHLEMTIGTPDDTHYQNWMYRGDQLVCTDPYHYAGFKHRPKPGDAYRPTVIDEDYIRELATSSSQPSARVQQEGNALRFKPIHEDHVRPPTGVGVLPQMRGDVAVPKIWSPKPIAARPVGSKARAFDVVMANRLVEPIRRRRADVIVVDDLDAKGADGPTAKRRVWNAMEQFLAARPNPSWMLKHINLDEFGNHVQDAFILDPAFALGRPRQEKVCDERPLADWEAFPLAESPRRGPAAKRARV